MCRSIKKLRRAESAPTDEELYGAALQFIRKISGYHAPSQANQEAFGSAVRDVAAASRSLFDKLAASGMQFNPRNPASFGRGQADPLCRNSE